MSTSKGPETVYHSTDASQNKYAGDGVIRPDVEPRANASRRTYHRGLFRYGLLLLGSCLATLAAATNTSCSGDALFIEGGGTGGRAEGQGGQADGQGGQADGQGGNDGFHLPTARECFDALEDELVAQCEPCHRPQAVADAPFFAGPDYYKSITLWPGIIVPVPFESSLLTVPGTYGHDGQYGPDMSQDLRVRVLRWLTKEAADLAGGEGGDGGHGGG